MIHFFTDSVLRAPTIGSMLMCFAAGLIGVLVFVRKRSLLGEALSHATYPGVTLAVICASAFGSGPFFVLGGAFLSALAGLGAIHFLERRLKVPSDAALCMILALFFGVGVTVASYVQYSHTYEYRNIQAYLYGQAATMTDEHILVYALLALGVVISIALFYKELQAISFDRPFALVAGIAARGVDVLVILLITFAVVIGIRSVGVVLMSAMLIAPATAARQYTNKLSKMFILSGFFGLISGFLGNVLSVVLSQALNARDPTWRATLPTGPMIVLIASSLALLSLLLAPERGVLIRFFRIAHFRYKRMQENLLKRMWREEGSIDLSGSSLSLRFTLYRMERKGFLKQLSRGTYLLTDEGQKRGAHIVRLHRLWEVYLFDYLGVGSERVHKSAEEMEHILTPELEEELTDLLNHPTQDPHAQPIPQPNEVMGRV